MNYKALALGALAGFVFALSPACGNGDDGEVCGPENCSTCCGADGQCVTTVDNAACGASGNACQACGTNQVCQAGACVAVSTDTGGNVEVCNASTCPNGCCNSLGKCQGGGTINNCGTGGVACDQCTGSEQCVAQGGTRSCQVPSTAGQLGAECTTDAECAPLGTGARCALASDDGSIQYERGFCTVPCMGTSCPSVGSVPGVCLVGQETFADGGTGDSLVGFTDDACFMRCNYNNAVTGCSNDMYCLPIAAGGVGACVPFTPAPAGVIGSACGNDAEACRFPPSSGWCYPETYQGELTGYTDGYCMADCENGNDIACGEDSLCVGVNQDGSVRWCLTPCAHADTKGPDCREGYTCYGLNSGNGGVCLPACDAEGGGCDAGETCNTTTGFCEATP